MAKDVKNACKYYTYDASSESNCFNVSWTFMGYSKLEIDKEHILILDRPNLCYLDLIFIKGSTYVNLYVRNKSSGIVTLDITTTLLNQDGNVLLNRNISGTSIQKEKYHFFYTYDSTIHQDPNSLPDDTLTFDIEFRIKNVETWDTFEERALHNYKIEKNLSKDLNKFILENHPTVVILKTKDSQIEANKAILCARSSVFKRMFDNPMKEQENDTVLIDDMMGNTVKILVDFLHTDEVDLKNLESSSLNELYYAADKYNVQDLRKTCAAYILHGLTLENVC